MNDCKKYPIPSMWKKTSWYQVLFVFITRLFVDSLFDSRSYHHSELIPEYRASDWHKLGLMPKYALSITPETVALLDQYGYAIHSVPRDSMHINSFILHDKHYFVFSRHAVETMDREEMMETIKNRKAFCFPYLYQVEKDFPEIFKKGWMAADRS